MQLHTTSPNTGNMGGIYSKRFGKRSKHKKKLGPRQQDPDKPVREYNAYSLAPGRAKTEEMEDFYLKEIMRNQLALDSQVFVLNQMLLGTQFFANYEV